MIIGHKHLNLYDKLFAEWMHVRPPFKVHQSMPNEACFIYILEGDARLRTPNTDLSGSQRDAVLLKCGNYIGDILPVSGDYKALVVHFYPEVMRKVFKDDFSVHFKTKTETTPSKASVIKKDEVLEKFFDSLLFYFQNPALADAELLALKIRELIMILSKIEENSTLHSVLSSLFSPEEYAFKDVIEQHIYTEVSLEDLAFLTGRSLSSFKRDFQKFYAESPSRYIRNRKLERAAQLLVSTDQRISDIIFRVGFNNQSHFNRIFSEKFGVNPGNYRVSHSAK